MKSKHNKKKIVLVLFLAIIYLLIVINLHKIKFIFSMVDIYNKNKNLETVVNEENAISRENIKNPLEQILIPNDLDSIEEPNNEQSNNEEPDNKNTDNENTNTENTNSIIKEPNKNQVENQTNSYKTIVGEYNTKLMDLQAKLERDLDNLIDKGFEELKSRNTTDKQLFLKYMSEGAELEKNSDKEFDSMISLMEKELLANNHDTSIIKQIEDYYDNIKIAKKQDIIDRGMKYLE